MLDFRSCQIALIYPVIWIPFQMYRPSHSPIPRIVPSKTRSTPTARIPHIANTTIDLPAGVGTLKVLSSETGCLLSGGFGTLGKLGVEVDDGLSSGRGTAGRLEAAMKGELTRFPAYFGKSAGHVRQPRGKRSWGGSRIREPVGKQWRTCCPGVCWV